MAGLLQPIAIHAVTHSAAPATPDFVIASIPLIGCRFRTTWKLCNCWLECNKVSHRRCRPTGDETGVVAVVEFCCVIGTEVVHCFGAREPVVKSDPEPLSTPDCATGCVLAPEHACQISFNGVPRRGRRRMSDGSFACALRRSGCT